MPKTSHSGRGIGPFHNCDRCGWTYRVSELSRQNGLLVCRPCFDNPIAWQRPMLIQDKVSDSEEIRIADILKDNRDDDSGVR